MDKKGTIIAVVLLSVILILLPIVPVSHTVKEPYEKIIKEPVEKTETYWVKVPYKVTKRETQILINDKPTVKPGYYGYYKCYIDTSHKEDNIVAGSIVETSGNDINFYVFDQKDFNAWRNGENVQPYVYAKRVKSYTFSFVPDHTDYYYFVLDNRYSWFTNKVPEIKVTWSYNTTTTKYKDVQKTRKVIVYENVTVTRYKDVKKMEYISILQFLFGY